MAKNYECRCLNRPSFPSWGRDSSAETEAIRKWQREHGDHEYAKERDVLAGALQQAEGAMQSGSAVLDMVNDVFGRPRGS